MGILIYSLKSMKKRWLKYTILFIQLVILTIVLNNLFSLVFYKNITRNKVNTFVDSSKLLHLKIDVDELMANYENKRDEKLKFFNYLRDNDNITGIYNVTNSSIYVEPDNRVIDKTEIMETFDGNVLELKGKSISYDMKNYFDGKLSSGRNFCKDDLIASKDIYDEIKKINMSNFIEGQSYEIPVLAGSSFYENYKIGENINGFILIGPKQRIKINYKIIGFISKDTPILTDSLGPFYQNKSSNINESLISLDSSLSKTNYDNESIIELTNKITPAIIVLKSSNDINTANSIQALADELDLKLKVSTYEETYTWFFDYIDERTIFELIKGGIIFLFIFSGIIASIFALINENKNEIATLMVVGFNNKRIVSIYAFQYLCIMISSYLVGSLISIKVNNSIQEGVLENTVSIYNVFIPFLIIICILITIILGIHLILKRSNPRELIGGYRE